MRIATMSRQKKQTSVMIRYDNCFDLSTFNRKENPVGGEDEAIETFF